MFPTFSDFWHCHSYILHHFNENVFTHVKYEILLHTDDDYDLYMTGGITLSTPFFFTLSTSTCQRQFTVEAIDDVLLEDLEETLSFSISLMSSDLLVEVDSTYGTQELTITDNER